MSSGQSLASLIEILLTGSDIEVYEAVGTTLDHGDLKLLSRAFSVVEERVGVEELPHVAGSIDLTCAQVCEGETVGNLFTIPLLMSPNRAEPMSGARIHEYLSSLLPEGSSIVLADGWVSPYDLLNLDPVSYRKISWSFLRQSLEGRGLITLDADTFPRFPVPQDDMEGGIEFVVDCTRPHSSKLVARHILAMLVTNKNQADSISIVHDMVNEELTPESLALLETGLKNITPGMTTLLVPSFPAVGAQFAVGTLECIALEQRMKSIESYSGIKPSVAYAYHGNEVHIRLTCEAFNVVEAVTIDLSGVDKNTISEIFTTSGRGNPALFSSVFELPDVDNHLIH